ncbi:MAG: hypothetical protein NZ583_07160 [Desulfobacterota bacterium]|nr:hypothetical protein [Thermodesulfobacteriota bacterium]MDW8002143.1 proton-conducting transporter membrane subunit [Deltaproteobacteria bacterium]
MSEHYPVLIVAFPLLMSFVTYMFGVFSKRFPYYLSLVTSIVVVLMSGKLLQTVVNGDGRVRYFIGGWEPPWGIEYVIDYINAPILASTSVIFFLLLLFTRNIVEKEIPHNKTGLFYSLLLLHLTGLLGVTATGDTFNLYVLLEILSFSAYGIVATEKKGSEFFAFRYMIFGTIGACSYLLGVGYVYILTGSLNMIELSGILPELPHSKALISAIVFFLTGILIKMASFPVHVWLPDAYSYAPSCVTVFLSCLSTKVAAYILIRLVVAILWPALGEGLTLVFEFLGGIAAFGILFAGLMAIAQRDVVRGLSYIIISEIGYILLALASLNSLGLKAAILHVINDMFMMASIFSIWAFLYVATGLSQVEEWKGLSQSFPLSGIILIISALSIIGIPPLCGFFSKWYILLSLLSSKKWVHSGVIILSGLLNLIYFFRLIENFYFQSEKGHKYGSGPKVEVEKIFTLDKFAILVLAGSLLLLGLKNRYIMERIISPGVSGVF